MGFSLLENVQIRMDIFLVHDRGRALSERFAYEDKGVNRLCVKEACRKWGGQASKSRCRWSGGAGTSTMEVIGDLRVQKRFESDGITNDAERITCV